MVAPYETLCELARGGMGCVHVALKRDGPFSRLYALKRLHGHADDAQSRRRLLDEARLAGLVRHPNVVSVIDVGEDGDGPYLVMDYVEGVSVSELIRAAAAKRHPLPISLCVRLAANAARGLHAVHEACSHEGEPVGIVHRDVSPQNVLVGFDGIARVTDFGIAKAFDDEAATTTGVLKGKVGYMSPEHLRFERIDRRSDLFSLGVVLFEMLSGRRLYAARETVAAARRILDEPAPDIGLVREEVPAALTELLFELLAKERELRPPDAKTVAERLEHIAIDLAVQDGELDVSEWIASEAGALRDTRTRQVALALSEARERKERAGRRRTYALWIAAGGAVVATAVALAGALALGAGHEPLERAVAPASKQPSLPPAPPQATSRVAIEPAGQLPGVAPAPPAGPQAASPSADPSSSGAVRPVTRRRSRARSSKHGPEPPRKRSWGWW